MAAAVSTPLLGNHDTETEDDIRRMSRAEVLRRYDVRNIDRRRFLKEWKTDHAGKSPHHRTSLGPTHRGKTTTELQMLNVEITPDDQAVLLSAKPPHRDPVMNKAAEQLNLVVVENFPPTDMQMRYHRKRGKRGYVVRPRQSMTDLDRDADNVRTEFRNAMLYCYAIKGRKVIIVHDEAHKIVNNYGLKKEYEAPLMSGLPDNASHSLIQRGRFMPYLSYDAPEDIILFHDPDLSNQRRYSEIGGVDPRVILSITQGLNTYETDDGHTISEFLHIRRAGPRLTIVGIE
jgi:hypothetical protein